MEQLSLEERWTRWEPIKNLSAKYCVDSIPNDPEGFMVLLSDSCDRGKRVKITFEGFICSYRRTGAELRSKILRELGEKYGDDFYTKWTFFKVENSRYIAWLSEQSGELVTSRDPVHFSLVATNSIVDVVAAWTEVGVGLPQVELLEK